MTYVRKTRDEWVIEGYYGDLYGWEEVTREDTRSEGLARLRDYRENDPFVTYRMRKVRVRIEATS